MSEVPINIRRFEYDNYHMPHTPHSPPALSALQQNITLAMRWLGMLSGEDRRHDERLSLQ